jgi:hypothetical protein
MKDNDPIYDYPQDDNFDEVLHLTEYHDNTPRHLSTIAEYENIDAKTVSKAHEIQAKNFVNRIAKFIIDFEDETLSSDHQKYLREVAQLQISDLGDMLTLVDINRQMLHNIVERINASELEDYAIINTYNMMVNQHLKLIKELQNQYRNIPSVMKKMKTEIFTDQVIEGGTEETITASYGESQFNNHKQLLQSILKKNQAGSTSQDGSLPS